MIPSSLQSSFINDHSSFSDHSSLAVAVIMDGNGRWANARGMPRVAGHREGAQAVRRIVEAAPSLGITTLTLYAFSSDNWARPPREVASLMHLFRSYLQSEAARLIENGVRLTVIGRRDRLGASLQHAIATAEEETRGGTTLHLRLAIDYSARDTILDAAARARALPEAELTREAFSTLLHESYTALGTPASVSPDVDLLIRTGGEQRLSDFMLWENAYAELYFTGIMWPDFDRVHLEQAIASFHSRQRRFGTAVEQVRRRA